ncbi:hypothetical protein ACHAW5_006325 [Stephanodiscus triporus]|uniref:Uncharacterized protein n=1 Tax=Stephanodiscus triporus TaxID=2934178 RepID=A0ABD3MDX1_9STRA
MPSSLAAALAATKKGGPAAVNTSGNNEDESPSRPSSLQLHNQKKDGMKRVERETVTKGPREKIKKHQGNTHNDDDDQREKTPPKKGDKNLDIEGSSKSNIKRGNKKGSKDTSPVKSNDVAAGEIVFVCDIPSDSDNDDGVCRDYADDNDRGRTKSVKRRGRRKKAKAPTPIKIADNSTGEIVFVCDIPSDSDDCVAECDGDCRDGGSKNNNSRSRGSGGGRSGRDNQGLQLADRGESGHGDNAKSGGKNLRKGNKESLVDGCKDRQIFNPPVSPSSMPTPWSIRAQGTKNNNDTGISTQGGGARSGGMNLRSGNITTTKGDRSNDRYITNPPGNSSSMPTPWSARADAMKNNDGCDKSTRKQSRDNDARAGRHPRDHFPCKGMISRERITSGAPNPTPTVTPANTVIKSGNEKELAAFSDIKLESTAIKGRWADEDSDDE